MAKSIGKQKPGTGSGNNSEGLNPGQLNPPKMSDDAKELPGEIPGDFPDEEEEIDPDDAGVEGNDDEIDNEKADGEIETNEIDESEIDGEDAGSEETKEKNGKQKIFSKDSDER